MYKLRRKLLSQNFLRNPELVKKLLDRSSIGKNDLVLEIGPRKGIITEELVKKSQHVIGVELDNSLYQYLQHHFKYSNSLTLYQGDILSFQLPRLPYKVFANIPFAIEGHIIRKLLSDSNPPQDCYLVMIKEVAQRLAGNSRDNLFSLSHKPFFYFEIFHEFRRSDFTPTPNVDSVMLRFTKRKQPLVSWSERTKYQRFLERGFGQGLPIFRNLKQYYGKKKTIKLLQKLNIAKDTKPSYIDLEKWIELYKCAEEAQKKLIFQ